MCHEEEMMHSQLSYGRWDFAVAGDMHTYSGEAPDVSDQTQIAPSKLASSSRNLRQSRETIHAELYIYVCPSRIRRKLAWAPVTTQAASET